MRFTVRLALVILAGLSSLARERAASSIYKSDFTVTVKEMSWEGLGGSVLLRFSVG